MVTLSDYLKTFWENRKKTVHLQLQPAELEQRALFLQTLSSSSLLEGNSSSVQCAAVYTKDRACIVQPFGWDAGGEDTGLTNHCIGNHFPLVD